jgi:hypothetical protein
MTRLERQSNSHDKANQHGVEEESDQRHSRSEPEPICPIYASRPVVIHKRARVLLVSAADHRAKSGQSLDPTTSFKGTIIQPLVCVPEHDTNPMNPVG